MKTPVLLWSDPGCGKTAAVAQFAQRHKLPFYAFIAAQEDPVDMCGVIVADNGQSVRKVPKWWKDACEKAMVILADELTACGPEQFAAVLRATDDSRELCGYKLHEETIVFAACNPPETAAGAARELAAPVLSRFRHRHIKSSDAVAWMNGGDGIMLEFPVKAPIKTLPRVVGAYLRNNPSAAMASGEIIRQAVETQKPFPCPRQWWRAAQDEGAIETWGEYIGEASAASFLNWFTKMDLPDAVEIIAGRCKTVPDRGDAVMATAAAVAGLLGTKPTDEACACAFDWYRLAAEAGHVANCAVDLRSVVAAIGTNRASKYPQTIKHYADVIRLAGN